MLTGDDEEDDDADGDGDDVEDLEIDSDSESESNSNNDSETKMEHWYDCLIWLTGSVEHDLIAFVIIILTVIKLHEAFSWIWSWKFTVCKICTHYMYYFFPLLLIKCYFKPVVIF